MSESSDLKVIFRTQSDIEASVVRGILETHGIRTLLASDLPHTVFPLTIDGLGEVRVSVTLDQVEAATQLIRDYRDEVTARVERVKDDLERLEASLGYRFHDQGLLEHALTHRSRAHEDVSNEVRDNESLEFLGDAVLGFVISDHLFRECPDYDEGQKSKARARLVSAPTLAHRADELGLGRHMLLGRGEEKTGGRRKPSLLADSFEAVVAAIYLDGGIEAAEAFIERQFRPALDAVREGRPELVTSPDYKSALQEWLQRHDRALPEYRLAGERGPDHQKVFEVQVWVDDQPVSTAEGGSKKEAEQAAAELALDALQATSPD